VNIPLNE